MDPNKIAEAAAKMRRPELRLNPEDYRKLPMQTAPSVPELVAARGIPIAADESVESGHMWLRDADPAPMDFLPLAPIEPVILSTMARMRDRWTTLSMDLGYSPSFATIATFEDERIAEVRAIDPAAFWTPEKTRARVAGMLGVAISTAAGLGARRPWKVTGRKATRARWRRMGRR
jgi:hypothetical protein